MKWVLIDQLFPNILPIILFINILAPCWPSFFLRSLIFLLCSISYNWYPDYIYRSHKGWWHLGISLQRLIMTKSTKIYPKYWKAQNFHDEKDCPRDSWCILTRPKKRFIDSICFEFFIIALESPYLLSILIKIVPPSKAD